MDFNFSKTAENTVNSNESNKLDEVKAAEARADVAESTDNASEATETNSEIASEAADVKKAVVTYVGHSEWIDNSGKKWRNGTTGTFSISEYEKREDIEFMVSYGEMKMQLI